MNEYDSIGDLAHREDAKGNVRSGLQVPGNGFCEVLYLDSLGNGFGEGL